MSEKITLYSGILLTGVFIGTASQVMLKKAAMRKYSSVIREYLNPLVILAYTLFLGTTLLSVLAYRVVPLSMGSVLESTSYIYITIWGAVIFKEKINGRKIAALGLIIVGILFYSIIG